MAKSIGLLAVSGAAAIVAALNERLYRLPYPLLLPILIAGLICLFVACRSYGENAASPRKAKAMPDSRGNVTLLVALFVAIAVGMIIYRNIYPDVPLTEGLAISGVVFVLGRFWFGRDAYSRRPRIQ